MVVRTGLRTDGFSSPAPPPTLDLNLAHGEGRGLLTRDGHDEEIPTCLVVGGAANNHGRTAFVG
jgi:hypothetical protein